MHFEETYFNQDIIIIIHQKKKQKNKTKLNIYEFLKIVIIK